MGVNIKRGFNRVYVVLAGLWLSWVVLAQVGCSHQATPQRNSPSAPDNAGQWVLESYDKNKGYTFLKDGVRYQAHCSGYYLSADGDDEVYDSRPTVNIEESTCSAVLPYLRAPLPLEQGLDTLYFRSNLNGRVKGRLEFKITEAR